MSQPSDGWYMEIGASIPEEFLVFADLEAKRRGLTRSDLLAELLQAVSTKQL